MTAIRTALTAVVASAAFLSACVPVMRNKFPTITGSVVDGTSIVAGAEVLIVTHPSHNCSGASNSVTADDSGAFLLPGKSNIEIAIFGGETESDWMLCLRSEGRTYFGFLYFAHQSPDAMKVRCDLKRAVKEMEHGVCVLEK